MDNRDLALDLFRRAVFLSEAARSLPFRYTAMLAADQQDTTSVSVEEWHLAFKGVAAAIVPIRDSIIEKAIVLWQAGEDENA